jgi:diguanylate cyclase (GGDEF)-like protein
LSNKPQPLPADERSPRLSLERVPELRLVLTAGGAASIFGALYGYLASRSPNELGGIELVIAAAALAAAFAIPGRLGAWLPAAAVGGLLVAETLGGRFDEGLGGSELGLVSCLVVALACASIVRFGLRRRDIELALALDAVSELTHRDPVVDQLSGARTLTWLEAEVERARRHHHELALVLVEPDRFDDFHALGGAVEQELLEAVAEVIGRELRATDVALRHGSSGFSLVLPETSAGGARVAAERLRLLLPLAIGETALGALSLSVGVAVFPRDASTNGELVDVAGLALARAQELGGNRTICASTDGGAPPGWSLRDERERQTGAHVD